MNTTHALAVITLAGSLQAQTTWTAQLSNPAFPLASGTVEATMPADTLLDPYIYFTASWQNILDVKDTTIQSELGGVIGGASPDNFRVNINQWPSHDLYGYEAKIWFNNHSDTLNGRFGIVPEPSTYALLTGLGLCAFAVWRKRGV